MTISYLDTSAAMKLIVQEDGTEFMRRWRPTARAVSSWLLHAELHCAAGRRPGVVSLDAVNIVLGTTHLIDVTRGDLLAAGTHARLRSNDAVHLATALRVGADEMVTYDAELARAAQSAGLRVLGIG